jgi:hypothetical protein
LGPRRSQRPGEASCTIHCTSSSNVARKASRVLAQMTSRLPGLRVGLTADEACFPRCGRPQRKIRNSSRPGSQAPHAPPALTFGLTGKQRVNWMQAGGDLIRSVRGLPHIGRVLRNPQARPQRFRATSACASPPMRSDPAGNRQIRSPAPSAPSGRARPWSGPAGYWSRGRSDPLQKR